MQFWVRIARWRARGGVDTAAVAIEAAGIDAAIGEAIRTLDLFLAGQPGVAILSSEVHGAVWARRVNMPSPVLAEAYAGRWRLLSTHSGGIPETEPCPVTSSISTTGPS